jgi:hypothetical protein
LADIKRKVLNGMNGVEILSSTSIYNTILPEWAIVISAFLFFISAIAGVVLICYDKDKLGISCIVLALMMLVVTFLGASLTTNSVHHIEYKVTIDDTVAMNDFMKQYEIIDQEGKIYTIKERG